jgi:thiamine pyrophosphokinase
LDAKPNVERAAFPQVANNGLPPDNVLPEDLIAQILNGDAPDQAEIAAALEEGENLSESGDLPPGSFMLAQANIAPPPEGSPQGGSSQGSGIPGVSEEDMARAHIRPWGSTLVMDLPDGRTVAVPGYFPGQNIGLPPDVAAKGGAVTQVSMAQFETSIAKLESAQAPTNSQQNTSGNQTSNNQPGNSVPGQQQAAGNGSNTGSDNGGQPGQHVDPAIANLIGDNPGGGGDIAGIQDLIGKDPELAKLLQETGLLGEPVVAQLEPQPQPDPRDFPQNTDLPREPEEPISQPDPGPDPIGIGFGPPPLPIEPVRDLVPVPPQPTGPPVVTPSNVGFLSSLGGSNLSSGTGLSLSGNAGSAITRSAVDGQNGNPLSGASVSGSIGSGFSASGFSGSMGSGYGVGALSGSTGSSGASGMGGSLGAAYGSSGVGGSLGGSGSSSNVSGSVGSGFSSSGVSGSTGSSYNVAALSGSTGSFGASGMGGSLGSSYGSSGVGGSLGGSGSSSGVSGSVGSGSTSSMSGTSTGYGTGVSGTYSNSNITAAAPNPDSAAGAAPVQMVSWYTFPVSGTINVSWASLDNFLVNTCGETGYGRNVMFVGSSADGADFVNFTDNQNWLSEYGPTYEGTHSIGSVINVTFEIGTGALTTTANTGYNGTTLHSSTGQTAFLSGYDYLTFEPGHLHPEMQYIIYNTNIGRFKYYQYGGLSKAVAFPGARNPDILSISLGLDDVDTISFYDPNNPASGNGDYNFVDTYSFIDNKGTTNVADDSTINVAPYTHISGVDIINAVGYGTNQVKLSTTAINAIAPTLNSGYHIIDIMGDAVDEVAVTDGSVWKYTGIIDKASYTANGGAVYGSTVSRFGNVQYEFQNQNGITFLNVSASFGLHPGFYWTDGGWGDDDGTDGNDFWVFPDTQFSNVNFGSGTDTLRIDGYIWNGSAYSYAKSVDFTASFSNGTGGSHLYNVEYISLIDASASGTAVQDTATVNAAFAYSATDANHKLNLIGDAADRFTVSDYTTGWSWSASNLSNGSDGLTYTQLYSVRYGTYLNIQTGRLSNTGTYFNGWSGGDLFDKSPDLSFTNLNGSQDGNATDTDTLKLTGAGNFDLTAVSAKIQNLEVVDVSGNSQANTVTINAATVATITDSRNMLTIVGDAASDGVTLTDPTNWMYVGSITWNAKTFYQYKTNDGGLKTLNVQSNLASTPGYIFYGGTTNDVFNAPSQSFTTMVGGTGTDSVVFADGNYNMVGLQSKMNGMEVIDAASHAGADTVTVNKAFVAAAGSSATINVLGTAATDSVALSDGTSWSWVGEVSGLGATLYQYKATDGTATLNVQKNLASTPGVFFNGTAGNDGFVAPDLTLASLAAGAGTDWLGISGTDYDFTQAGVAAKISNLEVIDASSNAGANTIVLNKTALGTMTDANHVLTVIGGAADRLSLTDVASGWTYVGSNISGTGSMSGKTFMQYLAVPEGYRINIQTELATGMGVYFNGWNTDETFSYADLSFSGLHGGRDGGTTDTDALKLTASGNFDLTGASAKIWNIEVVDVAGNSAANTVTINAATLNAITDTDHKLAILGDAASDGVAVSDTGWNFDGVTSGFSKTLLQYSKSGNTLYVQADLATKPAQTYTGTSGDNVLLAYDANFANLAFGAGTDTLQFATTGAYDLTSLNAANISGLEVVDAAGRAGADTVTVSKAFIAAATGGTLTVMGTTASDGAALSDATNWMYVGTVDWNPGSGSRSFYQYKSNDGGLSTLNVQSDLAATPGIIYYGAGLNDVFTAASHSFTTMVGGTGTDSVVFADGDYNMVGLQSKMTGMDVVDAAAHAGADTVTVNKAFVVGAGESATLNVLGTAATDVFQFSDATSWTWVGEVSWDPAGGIAYKDFYQYKATDGTATVNVQKDITNPGIIFYGTAGDNLFTTPGTGYATLDGGAGLDTLRFTSTNLDLTGLESKTANLEVVDGTNSHADSITIDKAFVAGASDTNNIVTVLGDTTDSVALSDGTSWSWVGEVSGLGATLYQYKATDGTATLNVQKNLASTPGVFFNGTAGNDGFVAPDLTLASLAAGAGTDWLGISGTDYDFTQAGVAAKISNLEVIDASSNAGANTIVLNKTALGTMTDANHVLTVIGGAADRLNLTDVASGWTYVGSNISGTGSMSGKTFMQYLAVPEGYRINIQTELATGMGVYFNGWNTDETFSYADLSFSGLHGGRDGGTTDTDSLKLTASGNFDLTGASAKIWNIEVVDVSGNSAANTVTINAATLNAITDADHKLAILGDAASDGVAVSDTGWNFDGVTSGFSKTLLQYSKSGNTLYVQADLASKPSQTFTGTTGNDTLLAYDANFANLAFGTGTDTLQFATTGAYDLTSLNAANISGLDVVDAAGRSGADTVTVSKAFVAAATGGTLTVMGTAASDGAALSDATNWMYVGTVNWDPGSGSRSFYQYKSNDGGTATLNVQSDLASTPGIIYYGAGLNDVFTAASHSFTTMVGGTGTDSVVFTDGDYNMVGLQSKMTGMDVVDAASHAGADTVTVNKAFVVGAGENATINVLGTAATDTFQFSDATSWTWVGEVSGLSTTLYQYKATDGTATVNVQKTITNPGIIFYGTTGDNLFTTPDTSYATLDGGAGIDTLRFSSTNLDLTGLESKTANLEVVDGTNAHADTITIDKAFVAGASDTNNIITVLGDTTDSVVLSDKANWSWKGEISAFGTTLYQYKSIDNGATLNVQKDLAGTPGIFFYGDGLADKDDKFIAPDLTFDTLVGGNGTDWLGISGTDYDFTQTGMAAKISNLEVIDASSNAGANTITLNKAFVNAVTDSNHILTVIGGGTDGVTLSDASSWSWLGQVAGSTDFTGMTFEQYKSLDGTTTLNILSSLASLPSFKMIGDIGGVRHDILDTSILNFTLLDGGQGTDFWKILVDGTHDLTAFGSKVDNIEAIDLGGIADGITISAEFVRDATSANWLVAQGDVGDTLNFDDNADWTYAGYIDAGGPWPSVHAYRGTADNGTSVMAYADTDLTSPNLDATGTAGNDLIRLMTKNYTNVDGGTGFDTLTVAGGNIDLTSGKTVQHIEHIYADNSQATTVTVNAASVAAADNKTMYVFGDDNQDSVATSNTDSWTLAGMAHYDNGQNAYVYDSTSGGSAVRLFAETTLDQSGINLAALAGSSGNDTLCTRDMNFGNVDGLNGLDRMQLLFSGNIDLTNLNPGNSLHNVEIIDARNWNANALVIDGSFVHDQGDVLYLLGDSSGDSFSFAASETWTDSGSYQISGGLELTKYTSNYNGAEVTVFADQNVTLT